MKSSKPTIFVWAQLLLCKEDQEQVHSVLTDLGVPARFLVRNLHITVYHARRPMPGAALGIHEADAVIEVADTRFMVMAPGGENPRPELDPALKKIGVRVVKNTPSWTAVQQYRSMMLAHETPAMLGSRKPSTAMRNAFGARHFQPHISLVRAGSGIGRDLKPYGKAFRERMSTLRFDRFLVEVKNSRGDTQ